VSRLHWTSAVAAIAVAATLPAGAQAQRAPRTATATARAFVAAAQARDGARACALVDLGPGVSRALCRRLVGAGSVPIVHARVEPGGLTRGRRARVTVALVSRAKGEAPVATRSRVLLRRAGGRWRITDGGLPGLGPWGDRDPGPDPVPAGAGAALRRLADDELLMLSGAPSMACALLAPGAPQGGQDGACGSFAFQRAIEASAIAARADRVVVRRTGDHARLEVTAIVDTAVRTAAPPRFRLRARRWTDTLFAVRAGGRWRLAKLSRKAYDVLGVPAPSDVASPEPTATWPFAETPSLSERPVPAECRTPPVLQPSTCREVWALAAGGGTVAWTDGFTSQGTRAVAAGAPVGPVGTAATHAISARETWLVQGVAPVADGALVVEQNAVDHAVRAIPVGPDGQPRGAARTLAAGHPDRGHEDEPVVVRGPVGAPTASVMVAPTTLLTLGPDGAPAAPARALPRLDDGFLEGGGLDGGGQVVRTADGALLGIGLDVDLRGALDVRAIGADGRPAAASVTQAPLAGHQLLSRSIAAAVAADGRVLVAWMEEDARRRGAVRAWAFDPAAPLASAPVTVATLADAEALWQTLDASALPGGGWGIAWPDTATGAHTLGMTAARLDAGGRPLAPARRLSTFAQRPDPGSEVLFGLAGDTVAWVEQPAVGLQQVRAAPLP
jgi:hypothetical protein